MSGPSHAKSLLLVEGANDEHVVYALAKRHELRERAFEVEDMKSVNRLLENIPVRLKVGGFERLGIVLDADESLADRWRALRQRVETRFPGLLPDNPAKNETIVELPEDNARLGVWVMPDNELPGILEHFMAYMVPPGDPLWSRVRSFIEELPGELRRFPPRRRSKAEIHAFLAVQNEPGKPLGQAITARYLDPTCPEAERFVDWLRQLFDA